MIDALRRRRIDEKVPGDTAFQFIERRGIALSR